MLWHPKSTNVNADKLHSKWFGPYRVPYVLSNNTILLISVQHFDHDLDVVNVNKLKPYRLLDDMVPTNIPYLAAPTTLVALASIGSCSDVGFQQPNLHYYTA